MKNSKLSYKELEKKNQFLENENREIRHSLESSEDKYKKLVDLSPDGIIIHEKGKILYANKSSAKILECEDFNFFIGKNAFDFVHPESLLLARQRVLEKKGFNEYIEEKFITIHGKTVEVEVAATLINFDNNECFQTVFRDISKRKKAEESIKASEENYKLIFNNVPLGIFHFNTESVIIKCNDNFVDIIGSSKEVLIGLNMIKSLKDSKIINGVKDTLAGNKSYYEDIYQSVTANKATPVIVIFNPVFDINNVVIGGVGIVEDLTEKKKFDNIIKEKELRLNTIIENSPIGIAFSRDGITLDANRAYLNLFGYNDISELKGTSLINQIAPQNRNEVIERIKNRISGDNSTHTYESTGLRKDGTQFPFLTSTNRIQFSDGSLTLAYFIDITDKIENTIKLKEKSDAIEAQNEEYQLLNEELTESLRRINKINQELTEARIKAEDSDKLKSAFLANMSHEIRTPMNGIIGFSEMLTDPDLEKEKQLQFIKIIQDCSNQLLSLIDDLIDVSKIESNQLKIDITPTNLDNIIYEAYSLFQPKIEKLNIEFYITPQLQDQNIIVLTDGGRLKQILINLLNNAIKFTNKGHIKIGYEIKNNIIEFFVEDTGIGIDKKYHGIIFERFRQAETLTGKNFGGTGLGLAISKSLVQLLGGNIWVQSEINKGASFFFTIPLNTVNSDDLQKEIYLNIDKLTIEKQLTILIAEDEPLNYHLFEEAFCKMNVTTIHAKNGADAVEFVKTEPAINLVLMDLKMPVMNGFDATRLIKNMRNDLPVIAQTAYTQPNDRKKAKEAGCDDYIVKPINQNRLLNLIHKYIS